MISLPQQRVLCRNPHHPAGCMRSEPCLFSNPPELPKRSRPQSEAGDACDGPVLFRRSPRRSRRDDSVLNADFPCYGRFVARSLSGYSYFPLAGNGNSPRAVSGFYWSSTVNGSSNAYNLYLASSSSSVTNNDRTYQYSVRCVRTVCTRTGSPSFAVRGSFAFPLAGWGSSPVAVNGYYWSRTSSSSAGHADYLGVAPTSSSVGYYAKTNQYSVRCVRTVCARTGSPSFAVRGSFAFPLAGSGSSPAAVRGDYWSSASYGGSATYAYSLGVEPARSSVTYGAKTNQYSVRCVRTVCARTGSPSFAVRGSFAFPLAGCGSGRADVDGYYWSGSRSGSTDAYLLSVTSASSSVTTNDRAYQYSVRCVRTVCARTGSPSCAVRGSFAFPLAGSGSGRADVDGYYWSSTAHSTSTSYAYFLAVSPTDSSMPSTPKTNQCSVRCVRTVCARTGSPSFAVRGSFALPLAGNGSGPADVRGYYWSSTVISGYNGGWYYLGVTPTSSSVTLDSKPSLYSVRCVRTVCARTGRPSFAVRDGFALPLAGNGSSPADVRGYYWSGPGGSCTAGAYYLYFGPGSSSVPYTDKTYQYSVRCVRTVCTRTGSLSFAVRDGFAFPLAGWGISSAAVAGYYWSSTSSSNAGHADFLGVEPARSSVTYGAKTYQYSVRCVRAVCARTGRPFYGI